jgi:hypothetical protein
MLPVLQQSCTLAVGHEATSVPPLPPVHRLRSEFWHSVPPDSRQKLSGEPSARFAVGQAVVAPPELLPLLLPELLPPLLPPRGGRGPQRGRGRYLN